MANIKNKYSSPLSTEFTPKDLVVDIKNGHLYYKSNLGVHKLVGDNLSTNTEEGDIWQSGVSNIISYTKGNVGIGTTTPGEALEVYGVISSSKVDSNFSIIGHSASFNYMSASHGAFGPNSITIGGTPFSKADLDNLKVGKSISTNASKKFVNSVDDTTYVRMGTSGKAWHYVSNTPILKLETGSITIGGTSNTPVEFTGDITASGNISIIGTTGSFDNFDGGSF
jgi:hypothetical protein